MEIQSTAKKIGTTGAITIPRQIRAKAGMFPGNAVSIKCEDDGTVILKTVVPCCSFCGSPEDVLNVLGTKVCRRCAQKISEKARNQNDN